MLSVPQVGLASNFGRGAGVGLDWKGDAYVREGGADRVAMDRQRHFSRRFAPTFMRGALQVGFSATIRKNNSHISC
jgi:hypothetical protein